MKVVCPQCNSSYTVANRNMPKKRAVAMCKKCGSKIVIESAIPGAVQSVVASAMASGSAPHSTTAPDPSGSAGKGIFVDYPELQGLSSEKFDFGEILSPNKRGGYKNRKNKFKIRILKAVHAILNEILEDGEKVMRVGKGTAYYPAEILLGNGILTMMYNYYAIACTNRRLLFININSRITRPTHFFSQMSYEDIKKMKQGLLLNHLILYRTSGKRRIFTSVKRYLLKELKEFIPLRKDTVRPAGHSTESLENLCPSCFVPLPKGLIACPKCKVNLKEPRRAFFKSLVLPGWGDIYLGHRALGILELIGSVIVWVFVISFLGQGGVGNLITAVFLLLIYNGHDGILTYHMGKKGYMLARD